MPVAVMHNKPFIDIGSTINQRHHLPSKLIKDQSIFSSVIILLVLITFSLDLLWILLGEN